MHRLKLWTYGHFYEAVNVVLWKPCFLNPSYLDTKFWVAICWIHIKIGLTDKNILCTTNEIIDLEAKKIKLSHCQTNMFINQYTAQHLEVKGQMIDTQDTINMVFNAFNILNTEEKKNLVRIL